MGDVVGAGAAGMMTDPTDSPLVLARGQLMAAASGQVAMMSLTGAPEVRTGFVTALATGGSDPREVTDKNSPRNITLPAMAPKCRGSRPKPWLLAHVPANLRRRTPFTHG